MRFTFIPPQMQSQVTPTSLSQLQAAGVCKVGRGRPLAAAGHVRPRGGATSTSRAGFSRNMWSGC